MTIRRQFWFLIAAFFLVQPAQAERLKDIVSVQGVRANQLVGYGLVVGLRGTGDSLRNSPFTSQSIKSMLDKMGVNVRGAESRTRNVAAVVVTAEMPPFIGRGSRIDVNVSSLGDASSLSGGSLIMTPLLAADRQVYAVAQGSVVVSGFATEGRAGSLTNGVPTSGRISNGAIIEREIHLDGRRLQTLKLELRNPDFATAVKVADVINQHSQNVFGRRIARAGNARMVEVERPAKMSATRLLAMIGQLNVQPDAPARIVVDERTGTIVIGKNVRISEVAVTHGNLTVRVTEEPAVVQPSPFSLGETATEDRTQIDAQQSTGQFAVVRGGDLQTLVNGLNKMGLKPPGIIAILQAIKSSGAMQAKLIVQ